MTVTGPSGGATSRWQRWKSILLVVSLALNLLVVGLVAAIGIRHGWRPPPGVQQATVLRFARTLPAERKHQIWAAIRSERRALRPYWREIREARAGVREALTAEPFDVNRYRIAHDRLLDAEVKARKAAHSLYENVATLMTAEERRQFADWQATAERQWRARHHRRRPPNPDDDDGDGAAPGDSQVRPAPSAPPIPAKQ